LSPTNVHFHISIFSRDDIRTDWNGIFATGSSLLGNYGHGKELTQDRDFVFLAIMFQPDHHSVASLAFSSLLSFLIVFLDPSFDLCHFRINDLLDTLIRGSILHNQIRTVETSRDNIQRGGFPRLKWPSRSERGGNTGRSPRIILTVFMLASSNGSSYHRGTVIIPIGPNQSCRVGQFPTLSPRVNLGFAFTLCASKGIAIHFGEVQRALSLPVFCIDGARHETWNTRWCATDKEKY
jgi:hypothetical protein